MRVCTIIIKIMFTIEINIFIIRGKSHKLWNKLIQLSSVAVHVG